MRFEQQQQQPAPTTTTTATATTSKQLCQFVEEVGEHAAAVARYHCEALRQQYMNCIGRPMPPSIHRKLLLDLIDGAEFEYYRYAIDEAAIAPQPSWRYVMAIVRRLQREKVPPSSLVEYL